MNETIIKHAFNVNDYIWPKEWRQMCACRQYRVIHITESGYILKQVDHRGRLWKNSIEVTKEWEDNYEVVPTKYRRKFEHKFNVGDKIYNLSDNNTYTIKKIIPDTGYRMTDMYFTDSIMQFKDEILYEKIDSNPEDIPLDHRLLIAKAEDVYLKTEGYKLEETLSLDDIELIKNDIDGKSDHI